MNEVTTGYNLDQIEEACQQIATELVNLTNAASDGVAQVKMAIDRCWWGEDCDKYKEKLQAAVDATVTDINTAFETMKSNLQSMGEEWVNFQKNLIQ